MKTRHIVIIAIFVLVNVGVLSTLNFSKEEDEEESAEIFVPTLSGQRINNVEENFNVQGYGTISSYNSVDISCEVQGRMITGNKELKPGAKFNRGDLLFRINDTEARYNIRALKSSFINIIANLLPDIKIDFNSEYVKWSNYIDEIKLNENLPNLPNWKTTKEKIFLSTRNVLTEYFSIKSLEEQLKKYYIRAPFKGMITDVFISDFSVVNPGAKIIRIVQTGNFEIPVSIPSSQLSGIQLGTKVKIYTTMGRLKGIGSVVRISEVINRNTQSVDVYVKPESIDGESFIQGEYVKVDLELNTENEGVRIPLKSINNKQVYIYSTKDSTLYAKVISSLNENENGVFVSGLTNGDILITQEVLNYTDSSKYTVIVK